MTTGTRLARIGLWLGLVGLPLLYCLLPLLVVAIAAGTPIEQSDIYIAGQLMQPTGPPTPVWQSLLRAVASLARMAWPVLLAAGISFLFMAGSTRLGQRYCPYWQLRPAYTLGQLGKRLVGLLVAAYVIGCLVHLLLPARVWDPVALLNQSVKPGIPDFLPAGWRQEEYWWPYVRPSAAAEQGYTLYSPLYATELGFYSIKATCIKLGALLATLFFYRRSHLRTAAALPAA